MNPFSPNFGMALTIKCSAETSDLCSMNAFTPWPKPFVVPPSPAPPTNPPPPPPPPRNPNRGETLYEHEHLERGEFLVKCFTINTQQGDVPIYKPPGGIQCNYAFYTGGGDFCMFLGGLPPTWDETTHTSTVNNSNGKGWNGESCSGLSVWKDHGFKPDSLMYDTVKLYSDDTNSPSLIFSSSTKESFQKILSGDKLPYSNAALGFSLWIKEPMASLWYDYGNGWISLWELTQQEERARPNCNVGGAAFGGGPIAVPCSQSNQIETCTAVCAVKTADEPSASSADHFRCDSAGKCLPDCSSNEVCKNLSNSTCTC